MRVHFIILCFVVISSMSFGCSKRRMAQNEFFEIIIVVSTNDCINCSATLYSLVQNDLPFHFIVEKFSDITILRKVLGSNYLGYEIIESPKLYKALCPLGRSSITLLKNENVIIQRDLKEVDEIVALANAMYRGVNRVHSFKIPEEITLSDRIQICASDSNLNILDEFTSTVYQFAKVNGNIILENTIELDNIPIKSLYVAKTNDTIGFRQFNLTRKKFAHYAPNSLQIKHMNTTNGVLFASIELQYPRQKTKDEIRFEPSYFIAEIVGGRIGDIKHIKRPFDDNNFPIVDEAFYVNASQVYTYFISKQLHEYSGEECYKFLIRYDIDQSINLERVMSQDFCLPSYWKDFGLSNLTTFHFDENIGYFMHFPWFVIESDSSWNQVIIDELHIDYSANRQFPPEKGIIINSVYSKNGYLYVLYYNQEDSYYKELVYSISNNEIISLINLFKYPAYIFNGQLQYDQRTGAIWAMNIEDGLIHYFF